MRTVALALALSAIPSVGATAPVPLHLMKEPAPVGTWVKYGANHFVVAEIRVTKHGGKFYRMVESDSLNESRGRWTTEASVLAVIRDESKFFFIYVDLDSLPNP